MTNKLFVVFCVLAVFGFLFISCSNPSNDNLLNGNGDLKYSVQVNNHLAAKTLAARTLVATDTVELYINSLEYCEDANPRGLLIIAAGDRDRGSKGGMLNNAGWYSVTSDLAVANDVNNGPYSGFGIQISKLRVNGIEYDFPIPSWGGREVVFGKATPGLPYSDYPDNFSGINITDSVTSLKTVLMVDPDILDGSGNLAADPYQYITVEGRVNE